MNDERKFSPSSFIPFCHFGDEFIGARMKEFETPVCNIFRPRIHLDQLCSETNLQELKDSQKIGNLKSNPKGILRKCKFLISNTKILPNFEGF